MLAGDTLALRFPGLIGKSGVLRVNSSESGSDRHADGVIVEAERRCHAHAA